MIVQSDHGYSLPFITKKGTILDLTNATVEVALSRGGEIVNKQARIIDPIKGQCEVILSSNDLRYMGSYTYQWTVYFQDGRIFSGNPSDFYVRDKIRDLPFGDGEDTVIVPFATTEELAALEQYVDGLVINGGGSVVQDSVTNGNIKVNNTEVKVYDDSALVGRIDTLEQSGVTGQDGKSAYQIWLDNGNSGTEANFLLSLKGEKGDSGTTGSGILTFQAISDLQTTYPNGHNVPVWIISENAWYYWEGTVTQPIDTTAPTVTVSPLAGTYTSSQNVTLSTNESAIIYYTLDESSPTTASTVYSSPISISTTKTLKYFAKDTAGNSSAVQTAVFTINIDTTAPILTITAGGTFTGTKSVTMAVNETATIYYTLDGSTPTTSSTVYSSPLSVSATTTLRAFARDTAGNSSAIQTIVYTLDTSTPADTTPPNNITDITFSNITQTSATLSWGAVSDAVSYDILRGSTLIGNVTGTTYNATGLTASTDYIFTVKPKDAANNTASGYSEQMTTAAVDTTPPNDVTGLVITNITSNSITATWNASASGDVASYDVTIEAV
jgi:hypothetical protein